MYVLATMKTAVVLAFLAGATAFSTSPATTRKASALNTVWDDYEGGIEFRAQKFQFDPVSSVVTVTEAVELVG